ncbi:MAG: hypothetical protein Q8L51_01690, partial [Candidatus Amesbacteria bacterium]|nr:hypothetical protein [Candidatus Amesbacteria bacterium]
QLFEKGAEFGTDTAPNKTQKFIGITDENTTATTVSQLFGRDRSYESPLELIHIGRKFGSTAEALKFFVDNETAFVKQLDLAAISKVAENLVPTAIENMRQAALTKSWFLDDARKENINKMFDDMQLKYRENADINTNLGGSGKVRGGEHFIETLNRAIAFLGGDSVNGNKNLPPASRVILNDVLTGISKAYTTESISQLASSNTNSEIRPLNELHKINEFAKDAWRIINDTDPAKNLANIEITSGKSPETKTKTQSPLAKEVTNRIQQVEALRTAMTNSTPEQIVALQNQVRSLTSTPVFTSTGDLYQYRDDNWQLTPQLAAPPTQPIPVYISVNTINGQPQINFNPLNFRNGVILALGPDNLYYGDDQIAVEFANKDRFKSNTNLTADTRQKNLQVKSIDEAIKSLRAERDALNPISVLFNPAPKTELNEEIVKLIDLRNELVPQTTAVVPLDQSPAQPVGIDNPQNIKSVVMVDANNNEKSIELSTLITLPEGVRIKVTDTNDQAVSYLKGKNNEWSQEVDTNPVVKQGIFATIAENLGIKFSGEKELETQESVIQPCEVNLGWQLIPVAYAASPCLTNSPHPVNDGDDITVSKTRSNYTIAKIGSNIQLLSPISGTVASSFTVSTTPQSIIVDSNILEFKLVGGQVMANLAKANSIQEIAVKALAEGYTVTFNGTAPINTVNVLVSLQSPTSGNTLEIKNGANEAHLHMASASRWELTRLDHGIKTSFFDTRQLNDYLAKVVIGVSANRASSWSDGIGNIFKIINAGIYAFIIAGFVGLILAATLGSSTTLLWIVGVPVFLFFWGSGLFIPTNYNYIASRIPATAGSVADRVLHNNQLPDGSPGENYERDPYIKTLARLGDTGFTLFRIFTAPLYRFVMGFPKAQALILHSTKFANFMDSLNPIPGFNHDVLDQVFLETTPEKRLDKLLKVGMPGDFIRLYQERVKEFAAIAGHELIKDGPSSGKLNHKVDTALGEIFPDTINVTNNPNIINVLNKAERLYLPSTKEDLPLIDVDTMHKLTSENGGVSGARVMQIQKIISGNLTTIIIQSGITNIERKWNGDFSTQFIPDGRQYLTVTFDQSTGNLTYHDGGTLPARYQFTTKFETISGPNVSPGKSSMALNWLMTYTYDSGTLTKGVYNPYLDAEHRMWEAFSGKLPRSWHPIEIVRWLSGADSSVDNASGKVAEPPKWITDIASNSATKAPGKFMTWVWNGTMETVIRAHSFGMNFRAYILIKGSNSGWSRIKMSKFDDPSATRHHLKPWLEFFVFNPWVQLVSPPAWGYAIANTLGWVDYMSGYPDYIHFILRNSKGGDDLATNIVKLNDSVGEVGQPAGDLAKKVGGLVAMIGGIGFMIWSLGSLVLNFAPELLKKIGFLGFEANPKPNIISDLFTASDFGKWFSNLVTTFDITSPIWVANQLLLAVVIILKAWFTLMVNVVGWFISAIFSANLWIAIPAIIVMMLFIITRPVKPDVKLGYTPHPVLGTHMIIAGKPTDSVVSKLDDVKTGMLSSKGTWAVGMTGLVSSVKGLNAKFNPLEISQKPYGLTTRLERSLRGIDNGFSSATNDLVDKIMNDNNHIYRAYKTSTKGLREEIYLTSITRTELIRRLNTADHTDFITLLSPGKVEVSQKYNPVGWNNGTTYWKPATKVTKTDFPPQINIGSQNIQTTFLSDTPIYKVTKNGIEINDSQTVDHTMFDDRSFNAGDKIVITYANPDDVTPGTDIGGLKYSFTEVEYTIVRNPDPSSTEIAAIQPGVTAVWHTNSPVPASPVGPAPLPAGDLDDFVTNLGLNGLKNPGLFETTKFNQMPWIIGGIIAIPLTLLVVVIFATGLLAMTSISSALTSSEYYNFINTQGYVSKFLALFGNNRSLELSNRSNLAIFALIWTTLTYSIANFWFFTPNHLNKYLDISLGTEFHQIVNHDTGPKAWFNQRGEVRRERIRAALWAKGLEQHVTIEGVTKWAMGFTNKLTIDSNWAKGIKLVTMAALAGLVIWAASAVLTGGVFIATIVLIVIWVVGIFGPMKLEHVYDWMKTGESIYNSFIPAIARANPLSHNEAWLNIKSAKGLNEQLSALVSARSPRTGAEITRLSNVIERQEKGIEPANAGQKLNLVNNPADTFPDYIDISDKEKVNIMLNKIESVYINEKLNNKSTAKSKFSWTPIKSFVILIGSSLLVGASLAVGSSFLTAIFGIIAAVSTGIVLFNIAKMGVRALRAVMHPWLISALGVIGSIAALFISLPFGLPFLIAGIILLYTTAQGFVPTIANQIPGYQYVFSSKAKLASAPASQMGDGKRSVFLSQDGGNTKLVSQIVHLNAINDIEHNLQYDGDYPVADSTTPPPDGSKFIVVYKEPT